MTCASGRRPIYFHVPPRVIFENRLFAPPAHQANECHLIVNGEAWVGEFAVWRFPVMQPSDIQVWKARPLPAHAWLVPDNCCICTTRGSGCVALGGGDYDGDLLMFTSNPTLVEFLHCTPSGIDMPEFITARAHIEGLVDQKQPILLRSVMHYREHVLKVPTPQVRGVLTAMAERAQQAALNSTDPFRDGSLMHAFYLAVAAEKAYDAPKKVDAQAIIRLGQKLLANAGLTSASPRSTIQLQEVFHLKRLQPEPEEALQAVMPSVVQLGQVWFPLNRITLSSAAGTVIRQRLFHHRRLGGLSDSSELFALDEITGALFHRLAGIGNVRAHVESGNADALIQGAMAFERARPKAIETVGHLKNTNLF